MAGRSRVLFSQVIVVDWSVGVVRIALFMSRTWLSCAPWVIGHRFSGGAIGSDASDRVRRAPANEPR
jgi:hypothetical protein